MKCETIKVATDDGYMIINKSDFDPKKHTEYGASPAISSSFAGVGSPGEPFAFGSVAKKPAKKAAKKASKKATKG